MILRTRPDLADFDHLDTLPAATGSFSVTWGGVATLLLDDGTDQFLTDGFFSRPSMRKVGLRRIRPDQERIERGLDALGADRVRVLLPVHSHYDHVMDAAVVAQRTGALLVGGESTLNVGRGGGLAEHQMQRVAARSSVPAGAWTVSVHPGRHSEPDRFPGEITAPVVPPVRSTAYRCGEAWSVHVEHPTGRRMLIQGSASFVPGALTGLQAQVVYLGVGQLGKLSVEHVRAYWNEVVRAVGARRVVLFHHDDFFHGLDEPLRALPYVGDDLGRTVERLTPLASTDGVSLHLPRLMVRQDPWQGLGGWDG